MIIIDRDRLLEVWHSCNTTVPDAVMLTTAEMEKNPRCKWGEYDLLAERYEKAQHERAMGEPRNSTWWGAKFKAREDWTSYGPFQMLGLLLRDMGLGSLIVRFDLVKSGASAYSLLDSFCCLAYDQHMSKLLDRHGLPEAFKRYNGSGPAAEAYMEKAIGIHERVKLIVKAV